ncbi:unnamed protein product [Rhizoctonia solani]|uniref:F-box domain-containing protein n=1 Tax=Rhizoctonia solani TaxID=456999 RepID=A0A8H2XEN0_9AGAM|nr:unnamed protein product [Rhizoctonia solani]CAE6532723.1 unnamed protein product [Rhizoctonia solani]
MLASLSPEITLLIADYLPHPAVAVASLVCKSWRSRTLAILFRSVALTSDSHIAHFSHTIANRVNLPFSISQHIRSLTIGTGLKDDSITESGLTSLASCTSHLFRLRELRWELPLVPDNVKVLELFKAQCHQLELVALLLPEELASGNTLGEYLCPTLTSPKFDNLVEFQLRMQYNPQRFGTNTSDPLNKMLANCPKLQSLRIQIMDDQSDTPTAHLDEFIALFDAQMTLPYLRKLHILGDIGMARESLIDSDTGSRHLRDFLSRHINIEELSLDCFLLYGSSRGSSRGSSSGNPEYLAKALPSLKRFCGPYFMCEILLRSSVAKRLECLSFQRVRFYRSVTLFTWGGKYPILPVPKLRELDVSKFGFGNILRVLTKLLPVAPELEELDLGNFYPDQSTTFLELFQYTPKLRKMSIFNLSFRLDYSDPLHVRSYWTTNPEFESLFEQMKKMCPELGVTKHWEGSMKLDKKNAKMIW